MNSLLRSLACFWPRVGGSCVAFITRRRATDETAQAVRRRTGFPLWTALKAMIFSVVLLSGATVTHGQGLDTTFDANVAPNVQFTSYVYAATVQPDGKILIGGVFASVLGVARNNIARLNADGTLDTAFNPGADGEVICITVQPDGKILVGGFFSNIGGQARPLLARLDATTGAADTAFNANAVGTNIFSVAVQTDGNIVVGGVFTNMGGQARINLARLGTTGAADSFNPSPSSTVRALAIQRDGKILVGGLFTTIAGQPRNRIARFDSNGTLDSFDPNVSNSVVRTFAIQADGKILVGGQFTGTIGGQPRLRIARLDPTTGAPDSFNPTASGIVFSIVVQADGKILLGGQFLTLSPNGGAAVTRNRIARVNSDGTLDAGFDPDADEQVYSIALRTDGKLMVGGTFLNIGGGAKSFLARLNNNTAATQSLAATQSTVTWTRGGSSAQFDRVTFESSTDAVNYSALGAGTPSGSNWTLTGLSLPGGQTISIRARGYYRTGYQGGSESSLELLQNFTFASPPTAYSAQTPPTTGDVGLAYAGYTFVANGSPAPTYAVQSGTLPGGLSLSSAGVLSGTPTASGTFSGIVVRATNGGGTLDTTPFTITIAPAVTVSPATMPNWTVNKSGYSQAFVGSNGTGAKTLSISAGAIPTGMTFVPATGVLSGTPTAAGTFNFTLRATDTINQTAQQAYTVVINPAVSVTSPTLADWTVNRPYNQLVSATGGTGAKTFAVTVGSPPTGLTLAPGGTLNGTPTATGTFNFTITATDTVGATGSQAYTVVINPAPTITTATLPNAQPGVLYNQTVTATGGTGTRTFSTSGTLPPTYAITLAGNISGTSPTTGSFTFNVIVTDAAGATDSKQYTVVVAAVTITPATLPVATAGTAYSQTLTVNNATLPLNSLSVASVSAGTTGLTAGNFAANLATGTMLLSFTPNAGITSPGTATFTVNATDGNSATASLSYTLTVNPVPNVNPVSNQTVVNGAGTLPLAFGGNVAGTVFSWINNTPSIGLAASGSGNIASFTATNAGNTPVVAIITVTPSYTNAGATSVGTPISFTVTVNPTPTVNAAANQVLANGSLTAAVNFSGAVPGTVFNWTNNTPSIGLAASGSGNIASFTAANAANAPVVATITVTPSYTNAGVTGFGTPITFTLTVNPTPNAAATPASQTTTSGAAITPIVLSGNVAGTVFNWTRDNTVAVTGIAASGAGNISGTLTNTTNAPVTVTFTVTPTANGVPGTPITATVTVNPAPNAVATPPSQTTTSGAAITTIVLSGNVAGTVFNWTRDNTIAVIGIAANGAGNISGTLTNTTNAPVTVTFTITPTANSVPGTPITATVTVNPTPNAVATPASQSITSGTAITTIVLSGNVAGTAFNWIRDNTVAVTGIAANGAGNISGTLTNTTNAPVTVTFTITPTANGVPGTPIAATVTVNPTANAVATPPSQTTTSGAAITPIGLTGNVAGTVFNWTRDNTVAVTGIAASGSGNISGSLTNTTNAPVTVTFTITPTANGVPGVAVTATVTVNPTPNAVATPASQSTTTGTAITTIVLSGNVAGTVFNWTRDHTVAVTGIAASGAGNISGLLTNTTNAPVTVTFTITPTANGVPGVPITATVTVNPTPNAVATPASQSTTTGTAITTIVLSGNVAGTVFNWTRDNTVAVTGIAASGAGNISGSLTNTTNAQVTVTFTITPMANGVTGPPIAATVTVAASTPVLSTVNPNSGQQGQTLASVALSGQFTHFVQGTSTVSFGAGITVNSLAVSSPTAATANVTIDPAASVGSRTVAVTTGAEVVSLSSGFTVTAIYAVSFNSNGGSAVAGQSVAPNATATLPNPAPIKAGSVFVGWYADAALTTPFSFATAIIADTTLYAKWSLVSYTGPSATGSGNITASFTGGGTGCSYNVAQYVPLSGAAASPPTGSAPAGVTFPHGLFDFTATGCTPLGSALSFTLTYPQVLPPGTQYWKYGPTPGGGANSTPHWYVLPAVISGNSITFSIVDGGLGDDDLLANGAIIDQGGPGVLIVADAAPIPAMHTQALAWLALLLLGFGARRMRRRT